MTFIQSSISTLLTNELSDYHVYRSTHHTLFKQHDSFLWIGLIVDPASDIILDCKWYSHQDLIFQEFVLKDELVFISNQVIGQLFSNFFSPPHLSSLHLKSSHLYSILNEVRKDEVGKESN